MASITEKINQLEAPDGEIGQHRQTLIEMETEIEKVLRPMKTYLLMTYAWRCRIHATKDIDNSTGILRRVEVQNILTTLSMNLLCCIINRTSLISTFITI